MTAPERDLPSRKYHGSGPLTPRYDEALLFVAAQHRGQLRKGSRVPYLSHLMSVSALVLEHGGSQDAAIAGLLHDAIEDAPEGQGPLVLAEIEQRFGLAVAAVVRSCSDGLDEAGTRSGSWSDRKLPYIETLGHKTPEAALVTAADKSHNARCITDDVRAYGQDFWSVFNACRHQLAWYYESVRKGIAPQLEHSTIRPVLDDAVAGLLAAAGLQAPPASESPEACRCAVRPERA